MTLLHTISTHQYISWKVRLYVSNVSLSVKRTIRSVNDHVYNVKVNGHTLKNNTD